MNVRETFLALTEYTTPFGFEDTLRPLLPAQATKDSVGNYIVRIGESRTLFTCHLDNYCTEHARVNHVFRGTCVGTDGTTVLGGDNKTGVVVMLAMIEAGVPGHYYFFVGEESSMPKGGAYGSTNALKLHRGEFENLDRCVAFDRRAKGSIITRQNARVCCSPEFVGALASALAESGLEFGPDPTGYYTDSATFMDVIPECTNLSSGTWNEHSHKEFVDLTYLEEVCRVACEVRWEDLPTVREARAVTTPEPTERLSKALRKADKETFWDVRWLLSLFSYKCLNPDEFAPGRNMIFSQWHHEGEIVVTILRGVITIGDQTVGDLPALVRALKLRPDHVLNLPSFYDDLLEVAEGRNVDAQDFSDVLKQHGLSHERFSLFSAQIPFLRATARGYTVVGPRPAEEPEGE